MTQKGSERPKVRSVNPYHYDRGPVGVVVGGASDARPRGVDFFKEFINRDLVLT